MDKKGQSAGSPLGSSRAAASSSGTPRGFGLSKSDIGAPTTPRTTTPRHVASADKSSPQSQGKILSQSDLIGSPHTPVGRASSSLRNKTPTSASDAKASRSKGEVVWKSDLGGISPVKTPTRELADSMFESSKVREKTSSGFFVSKALLEKDEFSDAAIKRDQIAKEIEGGSQSPEDIIARYIGRMLLGKDDPAQGPSFDLANTVLNFRKYLRKLEAEGKSVIGMAVRRGLFNIQQNILKIEELEQWLRSKELELVGKSAELDRIRSELQARFAQGAGEQDAEVLKLRNLIAANQEKNVRLESLISDATNEKTWQASEIARLNVVLADKERDFGLERQSFAQKESDFAREGQAFNQKRQAFEQQKRAFEQQRAGFEAEKARLEEERMGFVQRIARFEQELSGLNTAAGQSAQERQRLIDENLRLAAELENLKATRVGAQGKDAEIGRLSDQIAVNQAEIDRLSQLIRDREAEKDQQVAEIGRLRSQLAQAEGDLRQARVQFATSQQAFEQQRSQFQAERARFEAEKSGFETERAGFMQRIQGLEPFELQVQRLAAQAEQFELQVQRLTAQAEQFEQERRQERLGFQQQIEGFNIEKRGREGSMRDLDQQNQTLAAKNAALRELLGQQEVLLDQMRQQIQESTARNQLADERVAQLVSRAQELEREKALLVERLHQAEQNQQGFRRNDDEQARELRRRFEVLQQQLIDKDRELALAKHDNQEAVKIIEGMKELLTNLSASKGDRISQEILQQIIDLRQDFARFTQKTRSPFNPSANSAKPTRLIPSTRVNTKSSQDSIDCISSWGRVVSSAADYNPTDFGDSSSRGYTASQRYAATDLGGAQSSLPKGLGSRAKVPTLVSTPLPTPAASRRSSVAASNAASHTPSIIPKTPDDNFAFFDNMIKAAAVISFQDQDSKLNPHRKTQTNHEGNFRTIFKQFISVLNKILSSSNPALTPAELKNLDSVFNSAYCQSQNINQQSFIQKLQTDLNFQQDFFNWANAEAQFIKAGSAQHNAGVDHRAEGKDYPAQYAKYNRQTPPTSVGQPVVSYQVTKLYQDLSEIQSALSK